MWSKKGPEAQPRWLTNHWKTEPSLGSLHFLQVSVQLLTDTDLIKQCIDECTARIEIGLHYQIPYPRPIHLPPMGLTPLRGRGLRSQEKLRKFSKPIYLKSHDEVS
ncbi:LYR motif-containing protein 1 isoform X2 [Muntiacus reevesi]|uniref:LYR motif-containing protein 1 isoform X2 n=1 Tax=Muntiacus reevesi TaxID=9886 RepID=UPI003306D972